MFSVFWVADEESNFKQITASIPWIDNGFEVIGMETDFMKKTERVMKLKPNVVFLDSKMPCLNGSSFIKTVRENGLDTEFVILSVPETIEDARTFFRQEGIEYLVKPLQMAEVQFILEKLAMKLLIKYPRQIAEPDESTNPEFTSLVEYVRTHYYEKFTTEQLGKKFGLNAGYICALFLKNYHTTLACFVTQMRMEQARKLLNTSNFSLNQIKNECGYEDYSYFSKVFKEYYGTEPDFYDMERV
jgi:YesN/AraC family two-component response regulator